MPKRTDIKSVLIIGAGPIIIGQACEFDYFGAQACKALREEGYRVILVNSNPATIMTDPDMADAIYIEPITWQVVERIIEKERPDALLPTMGGQTALNCALDLARHGVLEKYGVEMIGASREAIDKAAARISLSYRDLLENPWADVAMKYPVTSTVHGQVTKLMEYGAFVQIEPGVEGLVHISELSHKRVWRTSDVVKEGDEIDAVVLSVDPEAQRISLSMKDLVPEPQPARQEQASEPEEPSPPSKARKKPTKPLQGGLGRSSAGDQFGLKW